VDSGLWIHISRFRFVGQIQLVHIQGVLPSCVQVVPKDDGFRYAPPILHVIGPRFIVGWVERSGTHQIDLERD